MSIAVTGGCGFIGSAIVKELNNQGLIDIDIIDFAGEDERWRNLSGLAFGEILDPNDGGFDPANYEVVFILGADSSTGITFQQATEDYRNALSIFERVDPEETRVIYASSAGTYGIDGRTYSDEAHASELIPKSPYAMCKNMIDMYASEKCQNVYGVKYSNVFGPGEYHKGKMASMIMQWYNMIKKGDRTPLFLPEDKFARDFIYVKDAARMTVELGLKDTIDDTGPFNIGSGEAILFKDVLLMVYDLMDKELNLNKMEMPESLKPQYQPFTELDMSKTASEIDVDTMDMQAAVLEYINYMDAGLRVGEELCPVE